MKVIITKYATTSGIKIREGTADDALVCVRCDNRALPGYPDYFHGNDWHRYADAAIEDVEARFSRKRAFFERQLKSLDEKRAKAINAIQASGL